MIRASFTGADGPGDDIDAGEASRCGVLLRGCGRIYSSRLVRRVTMSGYLPDGLSPSEMAALSLLPEKFGVHTSALREQIGAATPSDREMSGPDFFRNFHVPEELRGDFPDGELAGVYAEHPEVTAGVGFILFLRAGKIAWLEGYVFGVDDWPEDDAAFTYFVE